MPLQFHRHNPHLHTPARPTANMTLTGALALAAGIASLVSLASIAVHGQHHGEGRTAWSPSAPSTATASPSSHRLACGACLPPSHRLACGACLPPCSVAPSPRAPSAHSPPSSVSLLPGCPRRPPSFHSCPIGPKGYLLSQSPPATAAHRTDPFAGSGCECDTFCAGKCAINATKAAENVTLYRMTPAG